MLLVINGKEGCYFKGEKLISCSSWQQTAGLSGRFKAVSAPLFWRCHMFHLAHQHLYFPMVLLQKKRTKGGESRTNSSPFDYFLMILYVIGMCVGGGSTSSTTL